MFLQRPLHVPYAPYSCPTFSDIFARQQCATITFESVPSEKKRPLRPRHTGPPAPPTNAKLAANGAEVGTGFPLRKNRSIPVCARYATETNIARGGPGRPRSGSDPGNAEGTFFSLGTERDSTLTTLAYASEEKIHVPWRCDVFFVSPAVVKQAITRLMPKRVYIEHKVQDDTSFPASFLRVRASLHFAMSPHLTPAELDFIFGLASQGEPPAGVHAA